jgi:hypothetical protein
LDLFVVRKSRNHQVGKGIVVRVLDLASDVVEQIGARIATGRSGVTDYRHNGRVIPIRPGGQENLFEKAYQVGYMAY